METAELFQLQRLALIELGLVAVCGEQELVEWMKTAGLCQLQRLALIELG